MLMRLPESIHKEPTSSSKNARQNWLRASVLGANDGIISLAALVVGIAGASVNAHTLLITGVAGLLAGALSMALGEYVSVSSQRDVENAMLEKERFEHENFPEAELDELTAMYEKKGLSHETACLVASELTAIDAFAAHVDVELGIDPDDLTNPWHAAIASAISFSIGALVPLLAIVFAPEAIKVPVTFAAVLVALIVTGAMSARVSGTSMLRVVVRTTLGGTIAMAITFGIGKIFNVTVR